MSLIIGGKHPISHTLSLISEILDLNFNLQSGRGKNTKPYPLLEYAILKEGVSTFNKSSKLWTVNILFQLDILIKEADVLSMCKKDPLDIDLVREGLHYEYSKLIKKVITYMTFPKVISPDINPNDVIWRVYNFKNPKIIHTQYFTNSGSDRLTGTGSLISLDLDLNLDLCCPLQDIDPELVFKPNTLTYRKFNNS